MSSFPICPGQHKNGVPDCNLVSRGVPLDSIQPSLTARNIYNPSLWLILKQRYHRRFGVPPRELVNLCTNETRTRVDL